MRDYKRLVDMGPINPKDRIIIDSVQGQMSDGLWENSPSMEKYWKNQGRLDDEGKLPINGNSYYGNPYLNMDDAGIRNFYAKKIKAILKSESDYYPGGQFKQGDPTESRFLSRGEGKKVTYGDAYDLYQTLKRYL